MFDYTRAAGRKITRDVHRLSLALCVISQLFSIIYLVYVLLFGEGSLAVRISLLSLSSVYFLFFVVATAYSAKKRLKKRVRFFYQWSRRLMEIVNLGVIIYGFVTAEHTTFSLLLIAFFILSWALDVVIGILSFVLSGWLQLFLIGVETDLEAFKETLTAPFTATGNFFKRMTGKAIVEKEEYEKSEQQTLLSAMVEKERAERETEKQRILERRLQDKQTAKAFKKQEKVDKKRAKREEKARRRNPAPDLLEEIAPTDEV